MHDSKTTYVWFLKSMSAKNAINKPETSFYLSFIFKWNKCFHRFLFMLNIKIKMYDYFVTI